MERNATFEIVILTPEIGESTRSKAEHLREAHLSIFQFKYFSIFHPYMMGCTVKGLDEYGCAFLHTHQAQWTEYWRANEDSKIVNRRQALDAKYVYWACVGS